MVLLVSSIRNKISIKNNESDSVDECVCGNLLGTLQREDVPLRLPPFPL